MAERKSVSNWSLYNRANNYVVELFTKPNQAIEKINNILCLKDLQAKLSIFFKQ